MSQRSKLRSPQKPRQRRLRSERLEPRRLLAAEGTPFNFSQNVEITGLGAAPTAQVDWGDGTVTTEPVTGIGAAGPLKVTLDYRYDSSGFFNDASRRQLLQDTIDTVVSRFTDTLSAIRPTSANTWMARFRDPRSGNRLEITGPSIAANEIRIYVGARNMPGPQAGEGSRGSFGPLPFPSAWFNTVKARGEPGALGDETSATDIGPWGGSIAFDTSEKWHFGATTDGLDYDELDFVSVAMHEALHVLGFGSADSFERLVTSTGFAGDKAKQVYSGSGNVPMNGGGHFADSVVVDGSKTLMNASIVTGTRVPLTRIDLAAMDDIGWQIADNTGTVAASHTYADNGTYSIDAVVSSDAGLANKTLSDSVTITNVAPTLTAISDQTAVVGRSISLIDLGTIEDPGFRNTSASPATNETFTFSVDWGDGSDLAMGIATIDRVGSATRTTLASFNASYTYAAPGTYTVRITATDDDGGSDTDTVRMVVTPPPVLQVSLNRDEIPENAGPSAATLTIVRPASTAANSLVVNLSSSDSSELTVPSTITFDEDETSVAVDLDAIDDSLLDGPQTATIAASATGFVPDSVDVAILDVESLTAEVSATSVSEDAANTLALTLVRSNTDTDAALEVSFSGTNLSQLNLQSPLTIPADQQMVRIIIPPINDEVAELTKNVSMTFAAAPYADVNVAFDVLDDEAPAFQNQDLNFDVNGDNGTTAQDALLVINELNRQQGDVNLDPERDPFTGRWYDVNGDYLVSAFDALLVINELNRNATTTSPPNALRVAAVAPPSSNATPVTSSDDGDDAVAASSLELF